MEKQLWFQMFYEIGKWCVGLVASSGVLYGLFKLLGEKWIEHRFAIELEGFRSDRQKALEEFRSEQQQGLERLRHLLSSRISRIHEREFEVLPKALFLLHDASGSAFQAVLAMKQYPDFAKLPEDLFEEFVATRNLFSEHQKHAFRESKDRQKYYREAMEVIEIDAWREKNRLFNNYLIENRIFMTDALRSKFGGVSDVLSRALIDFENRSLTKDGSLYYSAETAVGELRSKIDPVEKEVQKRLGYGEA
jgi:hypothetical protein